MATIVSDILQMEYDCSTDLALLAGDFNINRFGIPVNLKNKCLGLDSDLADCFSRIDTEYDDLLACLNKEIGGKLLFNNLLDALGNKTVTYGDAKLIDGKVVAQEPILTEEFELGSQ